MEIKYCFKKLRPITEVMDGYSVNASVSPYSILETLFNYRQEDTSSWEDIITDIRLVMQTPNHQNIYDKTGLCYAGRYNIEQSETLKLVQVGWGSYNVVQPVEIISKNRLTTVIDLTTNQIFQFRTVEILEFVEQWCLFLKSDKVELQGFIMIELIDL